MIPRILFTAAFVSAIAVSGCQRSDDATTPAATGPVASSATPAETESASHPTDVIAEVDNAPAPEGLDVRAFAGSFKGTLPCADCPGIDTSVDLRADGTGTLSDKYRERNAETSETGTWTVEENGKRIRFDPDSKDERDRLYSVDSNNQISLLGSDGQPAASGLDYSLKRTGDAQ